MLRFSFGVSRTDRIRNKHISGAAQVRLSVDKIRAARFGHVSGYIGQKMLKMELPGRWKRETTEGGSWM